MEIEWISWDAQAADLDFLTSGLGRYRSFERLFGESTTFTGFHF